MSTFFFVAMILITGLITFQSPAHAASAGSIDTAFGNNGWAAHPPGNGGLIAIQPDGRVLVGGGAYGWTIARYMPDGSLDTSFGTGGLVKTTGVAVSAICVRPDGGILLVGSTTAGGFSEFFIEQLLSTGAPDPAFGSSGVVTTRAGAGDSTASGASLQTDGRLVVGGSSGQDAVLVRYMSDGTLDPSFGSGGIVKTAIGGTDSYLTSLALQNDGKVLVGGSAYDQASSTFGYALARYMPDGSLDPSFGTGGEAIVTLGTSDAAAVALAIQTDGTIVTAGTNGGRDFVLMRFAPDGTLDPSFGSGGIARTPVPTAAQSVLLRSMVLGPDGEILVAGSDGAQWVIARFLADGSRDETFGVGGFAYEYPPCWCPHSIDVGGMEADSLAVMADGTILVGGISPGSKIALTRLFGAPVPSASMTSPTGLFTSASELAVSWQGADGASSFDVRYRTMPDKGGPWSAWATLEQDTTSTSTHVSVAAGTEYCFEASATNGPPGLWSRPDCAATPIDDRGLSSSGAWQRVSGAQGFYHGTYTVGSQSGSTLSTPVDAGVVSIDTVKCPGCGSIAVYWGSELLKTISLRANTYQGDVIVNVLSMNFAQQGKITIKVTSSADPVIIDEMLASHAPGAFG
jgi:uncharacterized delta-60 repeat protein